MKIKKKHEHPPIVGMLPTKIPNTRTFIVYEIYSKIVELGVLAMALTATVTAITPRREQ